MIAQTICEFQKNLYTTEKTWNGENPGSLGPESDPKLGEGGGVEMRIGAVEIPGYIKEGQC
jgi:hypothetical protein